MSEQEISPFPDEEGDVRAWVDECIAAGLDAKAMMDLVPFAYGAVKLAIKNEFTRILRDVTGRNKAELANELSLSIRRRKEAVRAAEEEDDEADEEAARLNRAKWVNRLRALGGYLMPDVSGPKSTVEYMVIPDGDRDFEAVLGRWAAVPSEAEPDSLAPVIDLTREASMESRRAWIACLKREDPAAVPGKIRMIPRPLCVVLREGERDLLVITRDDYARVVTPEDVERGTWITKAGDMAPTGRDPADVAREAFRRLGERCTVVRREPRLDSDGHMLLLPRGVMPPGWRDLAPDSDRESALSCWKQAAEIVQRSPGGTAAWAWGAAIGSFFTRYNDLQGHVIDLFGPAVNTGKTSLMRSIGAMIGIPAEVVKTANFASATSAGSLLGSINYGFVPVDETQLFDKPDTERGAFVFNVSQGGQRIRSSLDGTTPRTSAMFGGVMFMTGNRRFATTAVMEQTMPGLSRRYIPVLIDADMPVFSDDTDATDVRTLTHAAHGWLVPLAIGSVTNEEFMTGLRARWIALKEIRPATNPEVLRLYALHLTGCDVLDRLLGTNLAAVAEQLVAQLTDENLPRPASADAAFITYVRDHIQANSGQWLRPAEYVAYQARDDSDDTDTRSLDRRPVGIRADDDSWFGILNEESLLALCGGLFLDKDTVLIALDRAGKIHRTDRDRRDGKWATWRKLGKVKGKDRGARLYMITASAVHEDDSEEDGPQDPEETGPAPKPAAPVADDGSTVTVFPGAEPVAEPLTGSKAPTAAASFTRPPWMPAKLEKDRDGKYAGVVKTFNELIVAQERRSRAYVRLHPYSADEDVPPPLRLLGRNMGTGVHEGSHSYTAALPAGTKVTVLDNNGSYLPALGSAWFPIMGLTEHVSGAGPDELRGVYQVAAWPELTAGYDGPHPWGILASIRSKEIWVTRETLDLGREAADAGIITSPEVTAAYLAPVSPVARKAAVRWEKLYRTLRDARTEAIEHGDRDALGFIKMIYSAGVNTLGESGANSQVWRPEFPPIIRSTSFANTWRKARKAQLAGLHVTGLKNNDEIHIAASPEEIFAATDANSKPVFTKGTGLADIKVKGGYETGPDGTITREWEA